MFKSQPPTASKELHGSSPLSMGATTNYASFAETPVREKPKSKKMIVFEKK